MEKLETLHAREILFILQIEISWAHLTPRVIDAIDTMKFNANRLNYCLVPDLGMYMYVRTITIFSNDFQCISALYHDVCHQIVWIWYRNDFVMKDDDDGKKIEIRSWIVTCDVRVCVSALRRETKSKLQKHERQTTCKWNFSLFQKKNRITWKKNTKIKSDFFSLSLQRDRIHHKERKRYTFRLKCNVFFFFLLVVSSWMCCCCFSSFSISIPDMLSLFSLWARFVRKLDEYCKSFDCFLITYIVIKLTYIAILNNKQKTVEKRNTQT